MNQLIVPVRISKVSTITLFLDTRIIHIFQKHLAKRLVIEIASRWLHTILPETSLFVSFDHFCDLFIRQMAIAGDRLLSALEIMMSMLRLVRI